MKCGWVVIYHNERTGNGWVMCPTRKFARELRALIQPTAQFTYLTRVCRAERK